MKKDKVSREERLVEKFVNSLELIAAEAGVHPLELSRDKYWEVSKSKKIPCLNSRALNKLGGYTVARDLFFSKDTAVNSLDEDYSDAYRQKVLEGYRDYVAKYGITPTAKAMADMGYTIASINRLFGNKLKLYKECASMYPDVFDSLVNDSLFTPEANKKLVSKIKKYNKFFVTTAVSGKEVHEGFLKSVKNYCLKNNALLIVLPCEDVASRNSIFKYELDSRLQGSDFAFKDIYLNEKIYLSSISVSAKQINPISGLKRLAQAKGSMALASPKQYLEFVANSNVKIPRALMTTGAVTLPDYSTDLYMSKRTSYLAEFDHVIGGIVIEISDSKLFHFRQVQASKDGSFIDLGKEYSSTGKVSKVKESVSVFGDTHVGSHDLEVDKCLKEIVKEVNSKEIIVHDLFDMRFNNHHEAHKPVTRAKITMEGKSSMMYEANITADWLDDWSNRVSKVTIVKSNHDEALERYIDEGRWKNDSENLYHACELVRKRLEGEDVLKHLIANMSTLKDKSKSKINWLERDQDYKVYGIENGAHGDLGANGSRGSMRNIESAYHKATVGHSHTAGIWRQIYQVGTSTHLKLHYNRGPSSWTNTMCVQYPNGSRQLITIVRSKDGKVYWRSKK